MDKIRHPGVIKYLHKNKLETKGIHADMIATKRDTAPSYDMVKRWAAHIKISRWARTASKKMTAMDDP